MTLLPSAKNLVWMPAILDTALRNCLHVQAELNLSSHADCTRPRGEKTKTAKQTQAALNVRW